MSESKRLGPFVDDFGDISLARIIVFMGVILGILIAGAGAVLCFWETLKKLGTNNGFPLAGAGIALISAAYALKGWQRSSEVRIANGASESDPQKAGS